MELQEFIKKTLIEISNGIKKANKELQASSDAGTFVIEPYALQRSESYITFDIAVTVSQETKKEGEGKIKILVANLGGDIGDKYKQEYASRIKFYVAADTRIK